MAQNSHFPTTSVSKQPQKKLAKPPHRSIATQLCTTVRRPLGLHSAVLVEERGVCLSGRSARRMHVSKFKGVSFLTITRTVIKQYLNVSIGKPLSGLVFINSMKSCEKICVRFFASHHTFIHQAILHH